MQFPVDVKYVDILAAVIDHLRGESGKPDSREKSLAVTKLQEAIFWLVEDEELHKTDLYPPSY